LLAFLLKRVYEMKTEHAIAEVLRWSWNELNQKESDLDLFCLFFPTPPARDRRACPCLASGPAAYGGPPHGGSPEWSVSRQLAGYLPGLGRSQSSVVGCSNDVTRFCRSREESTAECGCQDGGAAGKTGNPIIFRHAYCHLICALALVFHGL
jgi:hypothetical protein